MQSVEDFRYSLRLLRKTPGFASMILLVIVMSLSLYLASYTLGNMISHEPMPFPDGDSYVSLRAVDAGTGASVGRPEFDAYLFQRLLETSDSYSTLGAYFRRTSVLSDGEYARPYVAVSISLDLFQALATSPALGRGLSADDGLPGTERVILIGHRIWQEYYGGDKDIVGQTSLVDGAPHTIIGVMPPAFGFPRFGDFWLPLRVDLAALPGEGQKYSLVGVLKEELNYSAAAAELTALLNTEAATAPDHYDNLAGRIYDYSDSYAGPGAAFRLPLYLNFVTVLILVIAVVNLSALLSIRFNERKQELAVRSSLGANGWQLSNQVLSETFILCVAGLALSYGLSILMLNFFESSLLAQGIVFNYWFDFDLELSGFLVGAVCIFVVWLASCGVACFRAYKSDPGDLTSTGNKGASGGSNLAMGFIVGLELVLSCFLLICCGALIHLMLLVVNVDYGIDPEGLVTASVTLTHADYDSENTRLDYFEQLQSAMDQLPEIAAAALTSAPPQRPGRAGTYSSGDFEQLANEQAPRLTTVWASSNYFEVTGIQLLDGRLFDSGDSADSEAVALLPQSFARQLWPDGDALGNFVDTTIDGELTSLRVIGVISDVLHSSTSIQSLPSLYRPLAQGAPRAFSLLLRPQPGVAVADVDSLLRETATTIDRNIPLDDIRTLENQINFDQQGAAALVLIFILLASVVLLLASIGIYAVLARSIQLRTQEIGVRRALGSTNLAVSLRFVKQGCYFLAVSIGVGGGLACLLVATSASALGLSDLAFIPVVLTLLTLLMVIVVMTATVFPTRKAIILEPGDALRYE